MLNSKFYLNEQQVEAFRALAPSDEAYELWLKDYVTIIEPFYVSKAKDTYAVDLAARCHDAWLGACNEAVYKLLL